MLPFPPPHEMETCAGHRKCICQTRAWKYTRCARCARTRAMRWWWEGEDILLRWLRTFASRGPQGILLAHSLSYARAQEHAWDPRRRNNPRRRSIRITIEGRRNVRKNSPTAKPFPTCRRRNFPTFRRGHMFRRRCIPPGSHLENVSPSFYARQNVSPSTQLGRRGNVLDNGSDGETFDRSWAPKVQIEGRRNVASLYPSTAKRFRKCPQARSRQEGVSCPGES